MACNVMKVVAMSRATLAVLALVFPVGTAAAEVVDETGAPGNVEPAPVIEPPLAAPQVVAPVVAPVPPPKPADLARRWGVSARMVSMSLGSETAKTEYGGGGLAASYRINRRWEVALAIDALDAPEGPDLHVTTVSARFHLTPHRRWDWYIVAGLGMIHEAPPEGESHENADKTARGRFHAGVGLARRWRKWSLAAELHSVGVGPVEKSDEAEPMTTERTVPPTAMSTDESLSGGELTVAATFFF